MNSYNIDYTLDKNYQEVVQKTKEYLLTNKLPQTAPNIQEDYFASKRNSTLSL
jgi:hypothetical protein